MENTAKEIKRYTAREYYAATENTDALTELRNGEIINMSSPNIIHQKIVGELHFKILGYIRSNGGKCQIFAAPTDVKLNDSNVVIPDVFVACDPDKFDNQKYNGAPDLIIEVVSTNRADDYIRKLHLYQENGVREYWIVDPKNEKTVVFFFEEDCFVESYGFDETIPVNIYKTAPVKLEINIAELLAK